MSRLSPRHRSISSIRRLSVSIMVAPFTVYIRADRAICARLSTFDSVGCGRSVTWRETGRGAGRKSESPPRTGQDSSMNQSERIERFWRSSGMSSETAVPPAWSFGDSPELADELLELTLRGAKTAMASALWEFEAEGDPLPQPGDLSIVLDGAGKPQALIRTTEIEITPFGDVSAEHASLEREGDGSLSYWRA